jgi:hypothetical protein
MCAYTESTDLILKAFKKIIYRVTQSFNKLFEWLFSRVLTSHRGGPGSIPGWDGLMEMTLVKSLHVSKIR